jgi:hypothetical protein
MPAGRYTVLCECARIEREKWKKPKVEFLHRVVAGEFFGVTLPGWIPIDFWHDDPERQQVGPGSYSETCVRLLGRELELGENLDWEVMFVGKILEVEAGFRCRHPITNQEEDSTRKKGRWDFLRVHSILGLGQV